MSMFYAPSPASMKAQTQLPANAPYASVLQSLIGSLKAPNANLGPQDAMQAANNANAQRGQSILQLLSGQGGVAKQNNQQMFNNQLGDIQNSMISKGLAGTSIGDSLNLGAQKNLMLANNQVDENTARGVADMANSFTQQAPNMSLLAQLLQNGGGSRVAAPTQTSVINPAAMLSGGSGNTGVNGGYTGGVQTNPWGMTNSMWTGGSVSPGIVTNPNGQPGPYGGGGGTFDPTGGGTIQMQAPAASPLSTTGANPDMSDPNNAALLGLLAQFGG